MKKQELTSGVIALSLMAVFCSCRMVDVPQLKSQDYKRIQKGEEIQTNLKLNDKEIQDDDIYTCTLGKCKLSTFSIWFSRSTGFGLVMENDLREKEIDAVFSGERLENILRIVCESLKTDYFLVGRTVYVGSTENLDNCYLVKPVLRLRQEELTQFMERVSSDKSKFYTTADSILVFVDKGENVKRISEIIDSIERMNSYLYEFELMFVGFQFESSKTLNIGLEMAHNAGFVANSISIIKTYGSAMAQYLLNFVSSDDSRVQTKILKMVCRDGVKSSYQFGDTIRVDKHTISDNGTNTINGFETVQTGFQVAVTCRKAYSGVGLELEVSDDSISGYSESGAPNTKTAKLQCSCISDENWRFVGVFSASQDSKYFGTSKMGGDRFKRDFSVYVRCVPVTIAAETK